MGHRQGPEVYFGGRGGEKMYTRCGVWGGGNEEADLRVPKGPTLHGNRSCENKTENTRQKRRRRTGNYWTKGRKGGVGMP